VKRTFDFIRDDAASVGRELPADYAWGAYTTLALGEDSGEAQTRADEHLAWRYKEPRFVGDLAGRYNVAGDVDACVEGLLEFHDAGTTHVVLGPVPGEGQSVMNMIDEIGAGLLPALRIATRRG
jgi:alkanesulfonate monooxygenase SsuD/methylene tetrahydromethanopterin reductase-like flavin-dependent oxidoreductase (luciferase family)